jgi:hypothetical protein
MAAVPVASQQDPRFSDARLNYNLIVPFQKQGGAYVIDEDTSVRTAYLRQCMVRRLADMMVASDDRAQGVFDRLTSGNPDVGLVFVPLIQRVRESFQAAGLDKRPLEQRLKLAAELSDILLANFDIDGVQVGSAMRPWKGPAEWAGKPATAYLDNVLKRMREAAAAKGDPDAMEAYFASRPYIIEANANRPAGQKYRIRKPSDLNDFIVAEYASNNDVNATDRIETVMVDLGLYQDTGSDWNGSLPETFDCASTNLIAGIALYLFKFLDPAVPAEERAKNPFLKRLAQGL